MTETSTGSESQWEAALSELDGLFEDIEQKTKLESLSVPTKQARRKQQMRDKEIAHLKHKFKIIEMESEVISDDEEQKGDDYTLLKNENERLSHQLLAAQAYNSSLEDRLETYLSSTKQKVEKFVQQSARGNKKFKLRPKAKTRKIRMLEQKLSNIEKNKNYPKKRREIRDLRSVDEVYDELMRKESEDEDQLHDNADDFCRDMELPNLPGLEELKESVRRARDKQKYEFRRYSKIIKQLHHPFSLNRSKKIQEDHDGIQKNWDTMNECIKKVMKQSNETLLNILKLC